MGEIDNRSPDSAASAPGPLSGLRVVEFAGIGPVPFTCMLLADLGADIVQVVRVGTPFPDPRDPLRRGRSGIVELDLNSPSGIADAIALVDHADIVVEGFRPGVMERMGLGPDELMLRNPRLIFGRMTGWGQQGPRMHEAGHDINYLAPSGALAAIGPYGGKPVPPLNLVGDFGGGSLYLVLGVLAAVIERQRSGRGQVIDAAICDGVASLMAMVAGYAQAGPIPWTEERGTNIGDGGRHFYNSYACADGRYIAVGAIEPQFYAALREVAGMDDASFDRQHTNGDMAREQIERTAAIFATRPRDEWCALARGTDACLTPVLSMSEALQDSHNLARQTHIEIAGVHQPAPAPRFSRTPGKVQWSPTAPTSSGEVIARWQGRDATARDQPSNS